MMTKQILGVAAEDLKAGDYLQIDAKTGRVTRATIRLLASAKPYIPKLKYTLV